MRRPVAVVALLLAASGAGRVGAEPAAGLTSAGQLVTFDTAAPEALVVRAISGLQAMNERLLALDLRPATGEVFLVTVPIGIVANALVRTYTVDVATGALTFVGSIPNTIPGAADVATGFDFNPRVDRIRVVNANDENFRINPNTGAVAGDDPNLNPAGAQVVAVAYDRNVGGSTAPTTLYGISRATSSLVVQGGIDGTAPGGPNGGTITTVGPLGVPLDPGSDAGLDVSGATGTAFAVLRSGGVSRLYTINLATGLASAIGVFPLDVVDLTILPPPAPPPPDTTAPHALVDAPPTAKRKAVRQGLVVGFSCDEACRATAQLVAKGTVVAAGEATLAAAGVGSLTLAPTADGGVALRRRRSLKVQLSMMFADGAGNTSVVTRPLLVRR